MLSYTIKTYQPGTAPQDNQVFILNKGLNSGRPSYTPNPNCFVVTAATRQQADNIYWLSFALWKGNALHPVLRGSVIPFITKKDYHTHLIAAAKKITEPAQLEAVTETLKKIDQAEKLAKKQIKTLQEMRKIIFKKHLW